MIGSSLLNTEEAARFLRVSQASVRRWSDSGLLPARRVGRRRERRFVQADLQQFLGLPTGSIEAAGRPTATTLTVGGASIPVRSHLAPLYSTDLGRLRLSVPFLADGLRAGQPCFLEATGAVLERYADALTERGIDFAAATNSGQLAILEGPGSNAADAISNWEQVLGRALAGGPSNFVRIVGEMACVRHMFASDADMMAYEEAFDLMARRIPAVTLCQYDAREFNGEVMLRVLKAHPDLFEQNLGAFLV